MQKHVVFVHGMFQNPVSWEQWMRWFTEKGCICSAPAWPMHDGLPATLRKHPSPDLGSLKLEDVITAIVAHINTLPEKPIVIGHSVGGLIVQILVNRGLIALGVCISSVAPNTMLSLDWDFFKNSMDIANPFKGDEPIYTSPERFHASFCNTLSEEGALVAYERTAVHDSRNVLRDCMLAPGHIDLNKKHVPLLLLAGDEDKIIPEKLVEKNALAYNSEAGTVAWQEFAGRSHFICGEPGWEEVADYIYLWLEEQLEAERMLLTAGINT